MYLKNFLNIYQLTITSELSQYTAGITPSLSLFFTNEVIEPNSFWKDAIFLFCAFSGNNI